MKITISDGREYDIDPDLLNYLVLEYGGKLLAYYDKQDASIQFGLKLITQKMVREFLKSMGVDPKLPRGSDPTRFLLQAYLLMARESLDVTHVHVQELSGLLVDAGVSMMGDGEQFGADMREYLENLKYVGRSDGTELRLDDATDSGEAGTELAAGGETAQREDDGGEGYRPALLPALP